jgi:2-polyprenyl-6-methoxyphenol hydroxylase-like FAD-dependent oxidoreductase
VRGRLDVGVIGCGTAGPAAALFLARAGHTVTIYERVACPAPVGAGIILQPTGQAVLARLGLLDEVVSRGAKLTGLRVLGHGRGALLELAYADVDDGLFGLGLHRGVLFQVLFEAVKREGIGLRLGVSCEGLARGAGRTYSVVDERGERHGLHDLVVVADGAKSKLRDDTGLSRVVEPYPWGALWFVADDPDGVFVRELYQVVHGTRRMLGLLPTGFGPRGPGGDAPKTSLYWSLRATDYPAFLNGGFDAWRREVEDLAPHAGFVLDQIDGPEDVLFAGYHDVVMWPWHTRGVVYLGDAAHAMSPQLGQGANLALFDAWTLAAAVEEEKGDVVRALDRYTRAREAHLGYYQLVTRYLTPFFQSDYDVLGTLRDLAFPTMNKIGLLNRAMVLGMCGTADGHPWRRLALPDV